jgi:signal transduction histidine kinase
MRRDDQGRTVLPPRGMFPNGPGIASPECSPGGRLDKHAVLDAPINGSGLLIRWSVRVDNENRPRDRQHRLDPAAQQVRIRLAPIDEVRHGLIEGICRDAADASKPGTFSGLRGVTISGCPTALRRAVSNLVANAVKYGRSAAVSLIPETERVVITVEDEGPGNPRSEHEKVFEPFHRIEGSRNPDTGGVGLGLSVTRSIVWEHGGDIRLATRKGGGLSVRLELPAGPGPSSPD